MAVRNSKVDDVTIIAASDLGGIIGYSQKCLYGYNINLNDLSFEGLNGTALSKTDSKCGYIMGSKSQHYFPVKIAGFSRTGALPDFRMVGNQNDTPLGSPLPYGNDGYVIFADYEGKSLTGSRSTVFSNIYDYTNNVKDYNGLEVGADEARDNAPYVTSSPKVSIGADQFLTGDGVSSISYDSSAFKKIVDGRSKSPAAAGAYISGPETALTDDELAAIKAIYSNSRAEFEQSTGVTAQFPLLVISDTDYTKITPIINNYLRTLTNTNYNFADNDSNSAVFSTALNTCVFDKSSGTFVLQRPEDKPDNSANLYIQSINGKYYFRMNANSVDNGRQNAQFTLLDVQFKDPADTEKIAYHLYVPVLVKKLLRFEFNASIESGTPYYPEAFATKRTLFENLGNPVTVKFEYSYQRTESEWADAINQGENMLGNLYKSLSATYSGSTGVDDWPADTRLVLVDASNKDKSYYLDEPTNAADLEFSSFTDESGEHYAPVPLNDLMKVTITAKDSGKLVRNNVEVNGVETNTAENATVKGKDGYYYRMATDDELSGSVQKYEAAVTEVKKEVYYLSIFTPKAKDDTNIYHIELKTANKFAETAGQIGWRPNEVKGSNLPVHLLTGKLYDITFKLSDVSETGTTTMSSQNQFLKVTMKATVSLTDNAVRTGIPGNMQSAGTSTIYQTFMMTYDTKKAEGEPSVIGLSESAYLNTTILSYKIYKGKEIDEN